MNRESISFKEIYTRYYQDVYTFSLWICKDTDDAKDIASETFLRAWMASSPMQQSTLKSYLLTIARNLYLQKIKKQQRYTELHNNIATDEHTPENSIELESIQKVLSTFPEPAKTIFHLKVYQELSYQEISEIVKLSVSACKVAVFRVRKKLMTLFKTEEL